jgi:hypothetical protein
MPKPLDPDIAAILKAHKLGTDALWDCHGTWVMYHWAVERAAAQARISFEPPQVLEARSADKVVAICVTARMSDRVEWSIGEAAPSNNKNSYPFAMAEKRAKDRVALKLLGLSGLVYSEEEADDFKDSRPKDPPKSPPGITAAKAGVTMWVRELQACGDADSFEAILSSNDFKKMVAEVYTKFPSEWTGPEQYSGLRGQIEFVGKQLGAEATAQSYLVKVEKALRQKEAA